MEVRPIYRTFAVGIGFFQKSKARELTLWSVFCSIVVIRSQTKEFRTMITVSSNAKDYIDRLLAEKHAGPNTFLRVGVKSGGCSGLEYKLDFDTVEKEGDQVFEDKGVRVVVDMKSLLYLYGTELDYSGGLNGKGLSFNNPNASRTCSCGESFAV